MPTTSKYGAFAKLELDLPARQKRQSKASQFDIDAESHSPLTKLREISRFVIS